MGEERLTFSVSCLTVRGFFMHKDEWVAEPGQRLPCVLSGPIHVLKDGRKVGTVGAEAPHKFKEWIKRGGQMEAVVKDLPKTHLTKGEEVPVVFVLTGEKNIPMTNVMRAISADILKKQKRKKSLNIKDGDITHEMEITNEFGDGDFSIVGLTVRGFHRSMEIWVPEVGVPFCCSVSKEGSVQLLNTDGETIGNIPTEWQKSFKMFINANGVITAVVTGIPVKHRSKGEEVPMTYVFKGEWTNTLKNARNRIIKDFKQKSKKKKSLKFMLGDIEKQKGDIESQFDGAAGMSGEDRAMSTALKKDSKSEKQSEDMAQGSGETMLNATSARDEMQSVNMTDGSGERATKTKVSNDQAKNTTKRRLNGSVEKERRKLASTGQMQRAEENGASEENHTGPKNDEDKIILTEKNLSRISQQIRKTWKLLGIQLGFNYGQLEHFEYNNPRDVITQICKMLVEWKRIHADEATLYNFQQAMQCCPPVTFQQPELNKMFTEIRKEHQKTT